MKPLLGGDAIMPCFWSLEQFIEFISHPKARWITGGITVLCGPSALVDFEKYAVL